MDSTGKDECSMSLHHVSWRAFPSSDMKSFSNFAIQAHIVDDRVNTGALVHDLSIMNLLVSIVYLFCAITAVYGHGRMLRPTHRGSMWRFPKRYPEMAKLQDYDDHGLNAGGMGTTMGHGTPSQHGVCGDPYYQPQPRRHEAGGKFGVCTLHIH